MAKANKNKRITTKNQGNEISVGVSLIEKLTEAREACGFTQDRLATHVGMKQSAVARLENKSSMPRIDTMIKLLEPLGFTLAIVPSGTPSTKIVAKQKSEPRIAPKAEEQKPKESKSTERKVTRQKGTPPLRRSNDSYSQGPTRLINESGDMFD
ncbi:MAG: helix-turn-helix transcriptional regulator [Synergistaceae bacterium]|nr:helix-turn-helix transcriptional regulator [Synergistaceae bacterium]